MIVSAVPYLILESSSAYRYILHVDLEYGTVVALSSAGKKAERRLDCAYLVARFHLSLY